MYTAEEKEGDPDKLPILETVRVYLSIADHKVGIVLSLVFLHLASIFVVIKVSFTASVSCTLRLFKQKQYRTNNINSLG